MILRGGLEDLVHAPPALCFRLVVAFGPETEASGTLQSLARLKV